MSSITQLKRSNGVVLMFQIMLLVGMGYCLYRAPIASAAVVSAVSFALVAIRAIRTA